MESSPVHRGRHHQGKKRLIVSNGEHFRRQPTPNRVFYLGVRSCCSLFFSLFEGGNQLQTQILRRFPGCFLSGMELPQDFVLWHRSSSHYGFDLPDVVRWIDTSRKATGQFRPIPGPIYTLVDQIVSRLSFESMRGSNNTQKTEESKPSLRTSECALKHFPIERKTSASACQFFRAARSTKQTVWHKQNNKTITPTTPDISEVNVNHSILRK